MDPYTLIGPLSEAETLTFEEMVQSGFEATRAERDACSRVCAGALLAGELEMATWAARQAQVANRALYQVTLPRGIFNDG